MLLTIGILLSYLVGSIPTAYISGKLTKGIDIRKHGSGNVGATNAFRVLGPRIGIAVLVIDALKGLVCVVFVANFILKQQAVLNTHCYESIYDPKLLYEHFLKLQKDELFLRILLGIVSVLGHSFTIFLGFKGGKGMATTLGVLIGLSLKYASLKEILVLEILIWFLVFLLSKIVSLSSIVSAIFFPIFFIIFEEPLPLILMSLVLAIFVILRHKSNISRLLHNQEHRLNLRRKP